MGNSRRTFKNKSCTEKVRYEKEEDVFCSTFYQSVKGKVKLTYYKCEFCNGYHMTSLMAYEQKKRKK